MQRRLVFRIYLIGLAQIAALALTLNIARQASRPPLVAATRFMLNEITLASLVLVGISALLTAVWLGRPLARLSAAARALGGGDLSARANLRRDDELGDV